MDQLGSPEHQNAAFQAVMAGAKRNYTFARPRCETGAPRAGNQNSIAAGDVVETGLDTRPRSVRLDFRKLNPDQRVLFPPIDPCHTPADCGALGKQKPALVFQVNI